MQVFKTFFKLLKANKVIVMIYFVVFLIMVIILSKFKYKDGETGFIQEKMTVGIIDKDGGKYTDGMVKFFQEEHDLSFIEDDKDMILESLYWMALDYVLIIPEGFTDSLSADKPMELDVIKVPGTFDAEFFENNLVMYNSKLVNLMSLGLPIDAAADQLYSLKGETAEVKMASFINANQNDKVKGVFNNMPYFFVAVGVASVALILIAFNRQEVKDRTECGPTPLRERTAGIVAGILVFGFGMIAVAYVMALIFSGGKALHDERMPYFLLNTTTIMIFSLSVGYFAGSAVRSPEATNGIVNVVSLLLCFLGGVFLPQEFFSDGLKKAAQFVPTYWYVQNNELIAKAAEFDSEFIKKVLANASVSLLAAVAVFAVTLVIVNARRKRS